MSAQTTTQQMSIPKEVQSRISEQPTENSGMQQQQTLALRGGGCVKDCLITCCVCISIEDICCCEIDDICS